MDNKIVEKNITEIRTWTKGDRVKLLLDDEKAQGYFYHFTNKGTKNTIEIEVKHVYNGYTQTIDIDRNGKPITKFYTEKFIIDNKLDTKYFTKTVCVDVAVLKKLENGNIIRISETIYPTDFIDFKKGLNVKLDRWILKAYDFANANMDGDDVDFIWNKSINKYKALRELSIEQKQLVFDIIQNMLFDENNINDDYEFVNWAYSLKA